MSDNSKTGQSIGKQVPAGATGFVGIPADKPGTVESVKIRIYSGAENTLHLRPQKMKNGTFEDLLTYGDNGKHYVDGDDDVWEWDISEPVSGEHEIGVRFENTDPNNAHNFRANFDIDHYGGMDRVASFFKGVL